MYSKDYWCVNETEILFVSELFVGLDVLNSFVQVPSLSYLLKYGVGMVQSLFFETLEEVIPLGV